MHFEIRMKADEVRLHVRKVRGSLSHAKIDIFPFTAKVRPPMFIRDESGKILH
jgi:hypothetical protein